MALDDRITQEQLTPEQRRSMLRAFGDRMLLKITAMDDPEDMPGAERAVRVAAVIERLYSRCDRAERSIPDPHKLQAERARNAKEAIHARHALASTLSLGKRNREPLGDFWDAAGELIKPGVATPRVATPRTEKPATTPAKPRTPAPAQAPEAPSPLPGLPVPSPSMTVFEIADCAAILEKAVASELGLHRQDDTTPAKFKNGTAPQTPSPP